MDFVTVSTGLILPYWMGLPIRYIHTFVQFITYLITSIVWLVLALHLILSFGVYGATYYTLF